MNMQAFVKQIAEVATWPNSNVQLIPMRQSDMVRGCLIRFRLGTR